MPAPDDLQTDRQAVRRKTRGNRGGGMPGEIEEIGHAPTYQRIDGFAVDAGWTDGIAVRRIADRHACQRRRDDEIVGLEDFLDRGEDLRANHLIAQGVE